MKFVIIRILQRFRIWTSDRIEHLVRRRLRQDEFAKYWLGLGVKFSISKAEQHINGMPFQSANFVPGMVDPQTAWECEQFAMEYAEECKGLGTPDTVLGARLVSAIYGLLSIAGSDSKPLSEKARKCIKSKIELANELLQAYWQMKLEV